MKLELVSHPLCPYVHRTATLLREKGVAHDLKYVDLQNKPEWFLAISPRGKVPVLVVDGKPLFESAIINEFIDETHPPRVLPDDAFERARQRAYVEVASDLFLQMYKLTNAKTEEEHHKARKACDDVLARLEGDLRGPFFAGDALGLVDVAFAPAFHRLLVLEKATGARFFEKHPKVDAWARRVAARPSVKESVPADFEERYLAGLGDRAGWLTRSAS